MADDEDDPWLEEWQQKPWWQRHRVKLLVGGGFLAAFLLLGLIREWLS